MFGAVPPAPRSIRGHRRAVYCLALDRAAPTRHYITGADDCLVKVGGDGS